MHILQSFSARKDRRRPHIHPRYLENGTIVHLSRPSQHHENDLPSGAPDDLPFSPVQSKIAHFVAYFATPVLGSTLAIEPYRRSARIFPVDQDEADSREQSPGLELHLRHHTP